MKLESNILLTPSPIYIYIYAYGNVWYTEPTYKYSFQLLMYYDQEKEPDFVE